MKIWFQLIMIVMVILLAGCSTQETRAKPQEDPNQPSQQTNSTQPPPPFTFAVTGNFKPLNFEQDGKLMGFDVELGEEIARRIGRSPQPQMVSYAQLIPGLKEGKYEAVISSLSITPSRMQEVAFTIPYYVTGAQLFVLEQNQAASIEQLKDKKIGIIKGTPYMMLAQNHSKNIKEYPNYVEMLQDLTAEKIDAVLMDKMIGFTAKKEEKLNLKPIGELLYRDEIGMALIPANQELLQQINKTLEDMLADGTYMRMSRKWFDTDISK